MPASCDPRIQAVIAAYPPGLRKDLLRVRGLIDEAAESAGIGAPVETMKWGQPAYMPSRPRIGTTVRIDAFGS
ncbi:DUF1801 domain-containing protein [Microvirga subterranea]|uniref:YdhG-like domain-containing protein n=1 Tax=Microvirga subterranea TaxID=186651 RepID=A0A370HHP8_9HYPH|nr:DUF1801 domain-containing protein [Microvirga subterranea]RDI57727.1 hypothetical protein DES45_10639 [Microvirga subterranea]